MSEGSNAAAHPAIIEVALNGGASKALNPHVPITPEEIAADAIACVDAGASIVHSHIEDIRMAGEAAAERYAQAWRLLRAERPEVIIYPTIVLTDDPAQRFAHLAPLMREGLIEMAAFDPGSTNVAFPTGVDGLPANGMVYANGYPDIRLAFETLGALGLGPSLAIYEPGFLRATLGWHRAGKLPAGTFVKFYFGGDHNLLDGSSTDFSFGLPPTLKALDAYLEMLDGVALPWAVAVLGGDVTAGGLAGWALARGGHLRVGLEDHGGSEKPANVELMRRAAALVQAAQRPIASPAQARTILGLTAR